MSNEQFYIAMAVAVPIGIAIGALICWFMSSGDGDEW